MIGLIRLPEINNFEGLGSEPELNPGFRLVPVQDALQAEYLEVVRASLKDTDPPPLLFLL